MEITGKVKVVGDTQTFGSKGFQKRELVVTTEEQYPQHILIEFVQDKCSLLNQFRLGESVTVGINIRGREWVKDDGETKYFNSIQGWKIQSNGTPKADNQPFQTTDAVNDNDPDDLPF